MLPQENDPAKDIPPTSAAELTPRLLVDAMLGRLAKWLRLAGYDAEYWRDGPDEALMARAQAEGRLIVTRDSGLAGRREVRALRIHTEDLEDQIFIEEVTAEEVEEVEEVTAEEVEEVEEVTAEAPPLPEVAEAPAESLEVMESVVETTTQQIPTAEAPPLPEVETVAESVELEQARAPAAERMEEGLVTEPGVLPEEMLAQELPPEQVVEARIEQARLDEQRKIEEMKEAALEESMEASSIIKMDEKKGELELLKEKVVSLLPEGVGLDEEEEVSSVSREMTLEAEEVSPAQKGITKESIEAQAAKRAYLEKRYGKIGKLASEEEIAELEPDRIPLEWSGHLERITREREREVAAEAAREGAREREALAGAEAKGAGMEKTLDPSKILGAAFRTGDLKGGGKEFVSPHERIIDFAGAEVGAGPGLGVGLEEPVDALPVEELIERIPLEEREKPPREEVVALEPGEALVSREAPEMARPVAFTVEMLEAEMLEDFIAAEPPSEVLAGEKGEEAPVVTVTPQMTREDFLRVEELELEMLEDVVTEERGALRRAQEEVTASLEFEESGTLGSRLAGARELGGLEEEIEALEKEIFAKRETALEEDILSDIVEIERELLRETAEEKIAEAPPLPEVAEAPAEPLEVMESVVETAPQQVPTAEAPPLPEVAEAPAPVVERPAEVSPPAVAAEEEIYDMGSYTLERELAELTGAGRPQPTKKIKLTVRQPAKEGEKPVQEMAKGKGKPVPKVTRDKTVTKGIIMRIIDGIKKL